MTKMIRNEDQDVEALEASFHATMRRLVELSLVESSDGEIQFHPLLVWQLLENRASSHRQPEELVAATLRAITIVFLNIAQSRARPEQATLLLQGVNAALEQSDRDLMAAYLQQCAGTFLGFVPASIFVGIVSRAEDLLLAAADESAFHTLGFCAQTLCEMRHFSAAADIFNKILENERLPEGERGKALSALGTIFLMQRNWPQALEIYRNALEWKEKTGQNHQLGSTWHQIGMVYEEQHNWALALESYQKALEWNEKTGQHHELGCTLHQIGIVYQEQRNWAQALESYQKALDWNEKIGQHHELGGTWHQIGIVYQKQRDWPQALVSYQQALKWKEKTGQHHELGSTWHQIGRVNEEQRNWAQTLESYRQALKWKEKTGQHHELGSTWHHIGIVYQEQQDWSQALESYRKALDWNEKTSQHHELGATWHQIGRVYEEQKEYAEALRCYLRVFKLIIETGEEEPEIVLGSLRRIFPHLSLEEQDGLKEALPEELYTFLTSAED